MKDSSRARVAAVVAAAANAKRISSIYDYLASSYRSISAEVDTGRISGYDYSTSSHFSGGGGGQLGFFDYETSAHVQLTLEDKRFSGYDYHTGQHFSGTVNGHSVSLYDYQTGQYYNYSA